jgi:Glyoxalase/Bleomycin resistance protein/Dioxygenase superfamily
VLTGTARQNGFIVEDIEAACLHWARRFGAGPFFVVRHAPLASFRYQGVESEPDLSIALGNLGDLQIELIQQHNDAPSPYRDFATAKQSGLHHTSAWVNDYDAEQARQRELGAEPDCEGQLSDGMRFMYYGSTSVDGSALEVADLGHDNEFAAGFELVRQTHLAWDGDEPVRFLN